VRILFIGDLVGRSGRSSVMERLPGLMQDWRLDFVVINGENAAGGFGITETIYHDLIGPAPTPLRLAITPGTRKKRWSLSPVRRGSSVRSTIRRDAGAWRRPGRCPQRRPRACHQCHGPHFHGPAG